MTSCVRTDYMGASFLPLAGDRLSAIKVDGNVKDYAQKQFAISSR